MNLLETFAKYFICAAGVVSGAVVSVIVYGILLNKYFEWSLDRELKKKEKQADELSQDYLKKKKEEM